MSSNKNLIVQPYLFFNGRCEEAIEYYKKHLGAEQEMLMRYQESPEPPQPGCGDIPGDKIMHASLRIGNTTVMMSDGRCDGKPVFEGFAISLGAANEAEADKLFKPLSDGGEVLMPLSKTFFSPKFGMTKDRFGVMWMVIVHMPQ